jgi:tRNA threonylcarbamoyladenosine biosynthesis protein TsaB
MAILALDSSTEYLSFALSDSPNTYIEKVGQRHAELMLTALRHFLIENNISIQCITGIAYGKGPGSFTGLRIGCGFAQGFAFGRRIPLLGIGNLKALALQSNASHIISCFDARMGEVFLAAFAQPSPGELVEILAPGLYSPANLPSLPFESAVGIGSGFLAYEKALTTRYNILHFNAQAYPKASEILQLAEPLFEQGQGISATQARLLYLRDKVALTTAERAKI